MEALTVTEICFFKQEPFWGGVGKGGGGGGLLAVSTIDEFVYWY